MKINYKGFEISAHRARALGGWDNLYFYIERQSDGWFMEDSFTTGSDRVRDFIGYLKERVDNYLKDPTGECKEHAADETCDACEALRAKYYVDCPNACNADPERCERIDGTYVRCEGCGEPGVVYDLRESA